MTNQKKGKLPFTLQSISKEWRWSKSTVSRFLKKLEFKGVIKISTNKDGSILEIMNYRDYPLPSHQTPVRKRKTILVASIGGRLPNKDYTIAENFAIFMHRNWIKRHTDNKKLLKADLKVWSNPFRLMIEQDNRAKEDMVEVAKFAFDDKFWKDVILSPSGFRTNYDKIKAKFNNKKEDKPIKTTGQWKNDKINSGEIL